MTQEAFKAVRRHLKPGGTLVMNAFHEVGTGQDFQTASLEKTMKSVFSQVRIHGGEGGNVYFVAADRMELAFAHPMNLDDVHPDALESVKTDINHTLQTNSAHGRILTDDYNPVEYFDAVNRELIRKRYVLSVRP